MDRYTIETFPAAELTIEQYTTANLPGAYYVAARGTKVTDSTMDRAAAETARRALIAPRGAMRPTRQQIEAFKSIYDRPLDGGPAAPTYLQFRRTVRPAFGLDCYMVEWSGMWLGIEPDGYTHS